MGMSAPIANVAIIGANGTLGPAVLHALLATGSLTTTIITRESSKSQYPPSAHLLKVPDGASEDELAKKLEGQDALVVTMAGSKTAEQIHLANACVKAGVKRFIPADFGSVDSQDERPRQLVPLFGEKVKVRTHLEELASKHSGFSWSSLVCGHFFDWGLKGGFLHFDLKDGMADILDDGEVMWSTSTLARVGEAVVRTLERPDKTANKMLYIQSFCVNQFDVLEALMRASGMNFTNSFLKSEDYLQEQKRKADAGDKTAIEDLVFALGVLNADWTKKENFANELLGLEDEDLDAVIKQVYTSLANAVAGPGQ